MLEAGVGGATALHFQKLELAPYLAVWLLLYSNLPSSQHALTRQVITTGI